jgi:hypothetical protein
MYLNNVCDWLGDILSSEPGDDIFTKAAAQTDNIFVVVFLMELRDDIGDHITERFFGFDSDDFLQNVCRDGVLDGGDNFLFIFGKYENVLFVFEFGGGCENFEGVA